MYETMSFFKSNPTILSFNKYLYVSTGTLKTPPNVSVEMVVTWVPT